MPAKKGQSDERDLGFGLISPSVGSRQSRKPTKNKKG